MNAKYKQDTDDLNAKLSAQQADFAAEKLFGGYKFASDRVRKSVLDEFKDKGFKLENGEFVGGKEYLEGLKQSEPSVFAAEISRSRPFPHLVLAITTVTLVIPQARFL